MGNCYLKSLWDFLFGLITSVLAQPFSLCDFLPRHCHLYLRLWRKSSKIDFVGLCLKEIKFKAHFHSLSPAAARAEKRQQILRAHPSNTWKKSSSPFFYHWLTLIAAVCFFTWVCSGRTSPKAKTGLEDALFRLPATWRALTFECVWVSLLHRCLAFVDFKSNDCCWIIIKGKVAHIIKNEVGLEERGRTQSLFSLFSLYLLWWQQDILVR